MKEMKKYLAIYESVSTVDCTPFGTMEEANAAAMEMWRRLTDTEKKSRHVYVGYVTADCLTPDAIGEDGLIDFTALHSVYTPDGAFNSDKPWYAVQKDTGDEWGRGSYDLDEATAMLMSDDRYSLIAVIQNDTCIDEIYKKDISQN